MKREVWLVTVLLLGAILLSSCGKKSPEGIQFASSLEDALKAASAENKHIIAEFWSDG
jgi:hypothetical protein